MQKLGKRLETSSYIKLFWVFFWCRYCICPNKCTGATFQNEQEIDVALQSKYYFDRFCSKICARSGHWLTKSLRNMANDPHSCLLLIQLYCMTATFLPKPPFCPSSLFVYMHNSWTVVCTHRSGCLHCPSAIHHHFISLNWMPSGPLILPHLCFS